ncbi:hypothetical protein D3C72_2332670 [compost metagenome]
MQFPFVTKFFTISLYPNPFDLLEKRLLLDCSSLNLLIAKSKVFSEFLKITHGKNVLSVNVTEARKPKPKLLSGIGSTFCLKK